MEHSAVVLRRELKGRKGEEEELKGWELTCAVALGLRHPPSTPELLRRRLLRLLSSRVLGRPGWRLAFLSGVVRARTRAAASSSSVPELGLGLDLAHHPDRAGDIHPSFFFFPWAFPIFLR